VMPLAVAVVGWHVHVGPVFDQCLTDIFFLAAG